VQLLSNPAAVSSFVCFMAMLISADEIFTCTLTMVSKRALIVLWDVLIYHPYRDIEQSSKVGFPNIYATFPQTLVRELDFIGNGF